MTIREMRLRDCPPKCVHQHAHGPSDLPALREIFLRQGYEYQEPDWSKMVRAKVVADDQDRPRIALLSRPTVEMYALVDESEWAPPGLKAEEFARLDRVVVNDLRSMGYTDQHCWPPPQCRAFVRRLKKFFNWSTSSEWEGLVRYI